MPNLIVALGMSVPASAGAGAKRSAARAGCSIARAATVATASHKRFRRSDLGSLGGVMLSIWSLPEGHDCPDDSSCGGTKAISVPNYTSLINLMNSASRIQNAKSRDCILHAKLAKTRTLLNRCAKSQRMSRQET